MLPLFIQIECQPPDSVRIMSSPWEMEDSCAESSAAWSGKGSSSFPPQQAMHPSPLLPVPCTTPTPNIPYTISKSKRQLSCQVFWQPEWEDDPFVPFRQYPSFTFFIHVKGYAYNLIWGLCQMPKIGSYQPEERGRTRSEGKRGVKVKLLWDISCTLCADDGRSWGKAASRCQHPP